MDVLQARLSSFKSSKRTKGSNAKSTSAALKWPHPSSYKATPKVLAEAGFYFNPTSQFRDNVICYICKKELSDWEPTDDPFQIHWSKCSQTCPWAIVRCGLKEDQDEDGNYTFSDLTRLPTGKFMEKARLETFTYSGLWPHDDVRGHGASSKKMAKAGFVYTPLEDGDDSTTCLYCGTCLSGWNKEDNPIEEHRKRAVNKGQLCPFFAPKKPSAAALGRSTSRAPSSRLASKAPARTSPRTEKPRPVPEEEETSGVSSESDLTSLVFSTVKSKARSSARSKPSVGKSIATPASNDAPMSRRSTRGTGSNRRTPASQDAGSGLDERMDASGSETGKRVSKSKRGPLRGKKNITVIKEEEEEEAALDVDEEVEIVVKPKRGRPPGSKKTQAAASSGKGKKTPIEPPNVVDDSDMQPHPIPSKPANARTKSRTDTPPESSVPKSSSSKPSRSHTKTGTTSSSKSKSRIIVSSDEEADADLSSSGGGGGQQHVIRSGTTNNVPPQKFGPPKGRSASKAKAKTKGKAVESESEVERGLTVAKPKAIYVPIDTEENELGLRRLPNLKAKAGKSALKIVTPIQDEPRSKARKSSNTSDDAGYATAELAMEVEEDPPAPTVRLVTKASPIIDVPASPIHGDRDSGLAESIENSLPPARPNGSHASASKVASTTFRVSSAKRSGSVRPASQLGRRETTNKEIVDISSDEESSRPASAVLRNTVRTSSPIPTTDAPLPPSSSTSPLDVPFRDLAHSHATPASTHSATFNRLSSVPGTSSTNSKGKKKMVVEVVIPVSSGKRTSKSKQSLDVEMFDATGPKKQDPPNPRVPIDVDDDDDLHMNHVTSPPRTPTLSPVHPRAPSTPPMSRTNGRPIPSTSTEPTQTMSPGSFIPFLSQIPVQKLTFLTAEECAMTIEEYVRREIELQYQQLKKDAERRIEEFKIKAAKTRRILEDL